MDIISAIVNAILMGATAGLKDEATAAIKDAYEGMKALIKTKSIRASQSLEFLEGKPQSKARQDALKEELSEAGAEHDQDVLTFVHTLLDALKNHSPEVASQIGINLERVRADSLLISNVIAHGDAVRANDLTTLGSISITNVRAGVEERVTDDSKNKVTRNIIFNDVQARDIDIIDSITLSTARGQLIAFKNSLEYQEYLRDNPGISQSGCGTIAVLVFGGLISLSVTYTYESLLNIGISIICSLCVCVILFLVLMRLLARYVAPHLFKRSRGRITDPSNATKKKFAAIVIRVSEFITLENEDGERVAYRVAWGVVSGETLQPGDVGMAYLAYTNDPKGWILCDFRRTLHSDSPLDIAHAV